MPARETVRRIRRLPLPGEVLVEPGQPVEPDTVVARTGEVPGDPYVVDVRSALKLGRAGPEEVAAALRVRVGQRVAAGEALAAAGGREVPSPVGGTVELVSASLGWVLVREDARDPSPVVGVPVARLLDVWPPLVPALLRYQVGERVEAGAVLAERSSAFGTACVQAPVVGVIQHVDPDDGVVYLLRELREAQVQAYLRGRVEEVLPGEGAVITAPAAVLHGVYGVGGETWGPLRVAAGAGEVLTPDHLGPEDRGAVVVGGGPVSGAALERAAALGVRALVAAAADGTDLAAYLGHEPRAVTGLEPVPVTLVVVEGFGEGALPPGVLAELRALEGCMASVNGATQLKAGARRPELVVSLMGM